MSQQGLYVPKNAYFWANMAVFGQGSKSFGIHILENHLGTSFALIFWSGMVLNGPKKANIWLEMTKNAYFGPKILIFRG